MDASEPEVSPGDQRPPSIGFSYGSRIVQVISSYRELIRIRSYFFTNLGYAALTFAIGGMAFWMPRYLETVKGVSFEDSNRLTGSIVALAGLFGTLTGGFAGDLLMRWTRRAYLLISGAGVMTAIPFALAAIFSNNRHVFAPALAVSVF